MEKKGLLFAVSANGFPANIKIEGIEKYFSQKDRNHKNNLRKKVANHESNHPGAPPRAMSLVDKENISEPYVFYAVVLVPVEIVCPDAFLWLFSQWSGKKKLHKGKRAT